MLALAYSWVVLMFRGESSLGVLVALEMWPRLNAMEVFVVALSVVDLQK